MKSCHNHRDVVLKHRKKCQGCLQHLSFQNPFNGYFKGPSYLFLDFYCLTINLFMIDMTGSKN